MTTTKPMITAQSGKRRFGKGFSPDEIKEAGISNIDAKKLKISIDWKRKTSHEDNIANLKSQAEKAKAAAKPKVAKAPKAKKPKA